MANFSETLKYLRKNEGLTQAQLAEDLQISKSTVSMYENGNKEPDFKVLELIANYFNVNTDFLLGENNKNSIHAIITHLKNGNFTNKELEMIQFFIEFVDSKHKN